MLLLLVANAAIVSKLFGVEYSAYTHSIEGTFLAITRVLVKYPGEWSWWPLWNGGIPFENVYLPFSHFVVAFVSALTGWPASRSFYIVTAAMYVLSTPAAFWMALVLSRKLVASFVAALAYSCVSVSPLLMPTVAADAGGLLSLRRLHCLVFWGESPHTLALALVTVAVACLSRALTGRGPGWKILTGAVFALIALTNAFGVVALAVAVVCWLLAFRGAPWWKPPATVAAMGGVAYCWTAPWLSPAMIRAIRANSLTTGGDYRYTAGSWAALALLICGYFLLWVLLRRFKAPPDLAFLALFAYPFTAIVMTWQAWQVPVIPQPSRYQLEMDLGLILLAVLTGAAILDRVSTRVRTAVAVAAIAALTLKTGHTALYARRIIRSADPNRLSEYKIASWMNRNLPAQRAFVAGSTSLFFNAFTDNPQLHGGHDQHTVNPVIPMADFTIRTGMNAGARDTEISVLWLKAFGVRAIAVSGPNSTEHYKAFVNPQKFEGVLPLLWRDGDDAIYGVPSRSDSLAHVIPASAVPARTPVHGLDVEPVASYVAALENPKLPVADFRWKTMSEAVIRADVSAGHVVSVQVTYARGWEAWANGRPQAIRGDAIGQIVIEPDCAGPCTITLRYTGGAERTWTRAMSLGAVFTAISFVWISARRRTRA